jgi:hypothetical protein
MNVLIQMCACAYIYIYIIYVCIMYEPQPKIDPTIVNALWYLLLQRREISTRCNVFFQFVSTTKIGSTIRSSYFATKAIRYYRYVVLSLEDGVF